MTAIIMNSEKENWFQRLREKQSVIDTYKEKLNTLCTQ